MKNIVFIALLSLTLTLNLKAQKADYATMKKSIEAKFWVDLDTVDLCDMIIFNGVVLDPSTIDEELNKYRWNEVLVTELADLTNTSLIHKNCSFLIVLGTGDNQPKDDKLRILDSIRTNLNENVPEVKIRDFLCGKCKQVIIDGRLYDLYDAKKIVNGLDVNDIKYIADYNSANPSAYGRNAENGLIEIFLTGKKKKSW